MDLFSDNLPVTDLGNAIRLFRESREGFVTLFNKSPVCMSMTTTTLGKRTYVHVNEKFVEKFGYTENEIIGRTSIEIGILDPDESARVRAIIEEKGRLQNDYVKCITKDRRIVHTVSSIEYMEMNNQQFLVSFFVDITQIIDQQAIIEQHSKQLQALNKELEAFSYSVSHDLRAPLRAIDGYTSALAEDFSDKFDDSGRRMLEAVQSNAKRMDHLINDLLEFSKLGKQEMVKSEVDMNQMIKEIASDLQKFYNDRSEIKIHALHSIRGDYSLLRQVMINLISNGLKYSSKRENPFVEISSEQNGNEIIFTIRDNGAGFDMNYSGKLFNVFQRLHNASEFDGTGVGLAIVQRIVARHGGSVRAESQKGNGATFYVNIPLNA